MTKQEYIDRYGLEAYEAQKRYNKAYNKIYRKHGKKGKTIMPKNPKAAVDSLIARGKFTQIKVESKANLTLTYKALKQKYPDAYFEKTDRYLIFYNEHKLTAYYIE